jgi:hypothetical protein
MMLGVFITAQLVCLYDTRAPRRHQYILHITAKGVASYLKKNKKKTEFRVE